jgi:hypothetical protein
MKRPETPPVPHLFRKNNYVELPLPIEAIKREMEVVTKKSSEGYQQRGNSKRLRWLLKISHRP